ncbi:hypothetical protein CTEN210_11499 [Chaetoceros tenuissimus]|uniref:EGF-like domain-containing protein n=1 Tax=Chaetoceros tenuissimus TaxID=426638 RepID=A0AAD3H9L1_9STRA|nr:hypothetical protein CTEN210_11499 [Chaetoceros tenuissimus]
MLLSKGYALAILASISSIAHIDCVQAKNASVLRREYGRNSKVRTGKRSGLRFVPNSSHRALESPSKGKGSGDTETVSAPSKGKGSGDIIPAQEIGSGSGFTNKCYDYLLDIASDTVNIQDASAPTKGSYSGKGKSSSLRAPQRRLSSSNGSSKGSTSGTDKSAENLENVASSIDQYGQCVEKVVKDLIERSSMLQIADEDQATEREILIELLYSLQGDTAAMMDSLATQPHCNLDWVSCDETSGLVTKIVLTDLKGVLPSNIEELSSLLKLDLTGTDLSFDNNLFTKLPERIEKILFSGISYKPTDEDLGALTDLAYLTDFVYNDNSITHELAYLPFSSNVKRVFLKDNLMTCLPVFGESTKLEILSVENNDIYAINIACSTFDEATEFQFIITKNENVIKESLSSFCGCETVVSLEDHEFLIHDNFQCEDGEVIESDPEENIEETPEEAPASGSSKSAPKSERSEGTKSNEIDSGKSGSAASSSSESAGGSGESLPGSGTSDSGKSGSAASSSSESAGGSGESLPGSGTSDSDKSGSATSSKTSSVSPEKLPSGSTSGSDKSGSATSSKTSSVSPEKLPSGSTSSSDKSGSATASQEASSASSLKSPSATSGSDKSGSAASSKASSASSLKSPSATSGSDKSGSATSSQEASSASSAKSPSGTSGSDKSGSATSSQEASSASSAKSPSGTSGSDKSGSATSSGPIDPEPVPVCAPGFSGTSCENSVCDNEDCSDNGSCSVNDSGAAVCGCDAGFSGTSCENSVCDNEDCSNHGSCSVNDSGASVCSCDAGYSGLACENSVCDNEDCSDNGSCSVDDYGAAVCGCDAGYSGLACENSVCDNEDCSDNGSCSVDDYGAAVCGCDAGYSGLACENSVCDDENCSDNGSCSVNDYGAAVCGCDAGYSGPSCENSVCDNEDCSNHGSCSVNDSGAAVCSCDAGYSGLACENSVCDNEDCSDNGSCSINDSGAAVCSCDAGFSGDICQSQDSPEPGDLFECIQPPEFDITAEQCSSTIGIQATNSNIAAGTVNLKMEYDEKDIAGVLTPGFYYSLTANIVGSGDCTVIPYEDPATEEGKSCENMKSQIGSTTESGELWSEAILTYRLGGYEEKCCIDEIDVSGENILIDHGFVAGFDTEFTVAIHFDLLLEGCGDDDDGPQTAWAMHPVGDCPLSDPDYLVVASRHGWGKAVVFKTPASAS